ncbi:MAG: recombinase family protein [Clostridia bacterium]|nr:recombinase family protein [Clostridia bacterium]
MMIAIYCRVSTDKYDQINSFESQKRYYTELISRNPEWQLYRIYADEGISGTTTAKRIEFNRMISDAYRGRFNLIITKAVSRFSRNILDTISFTRELKSLGVGVLFMTDGINTLDPDAELRLSIMGSIAQEESRKTSARVKWGQSRQMERGVVFGRAMLGYDVKDGRMTIEPKGAELVRMIFNKYGNENKGATVIAVEMASLESNYHVRRKWTPGYIIKILKNEKYAGDLVQKKTITTDYLTHRKKYNCGEEEMIRLHNHHEPIIDRELWERVQLRLADRNKLANSQVSHSSRYAFSGKIKCGECGRSFVSRNRVGKNGKYKTWVCYGSLSKNRITNENNCTLRTSIRDTEAIEMVRASLKSMNYERKKIENVIAEAVHRAIDCGREDCSKSEADIQIYIQELIQFEQISDEMVSKLVECLTVFNDKHCELKLNGVYYTWKFIRK